MLFPLPLLLFMDTLGNSPHYIISVNLQTSLNFPWLCFAPYLAEYTQLARTRCEVGNSQTHAPSRRCILHWPSARFYVAPAKGKRRKLAPPNGRTRPPGKLQIEPRYVGWDQH
jgi:hypothetical protein